MIRWNDYFRPTQINWSNKGMIFLTKLAELSTTRRSQAAVKGRGFIEVRMKKTKHEKKNDEKLFENRTENEGLKTKFGRLYFIFAFRYFFFRIFCIIFISPFLSLLLFFDFYFILFLEKNYGYNYYAKP